MATPLPPADEWREARRSRVLVDMTAAGLAMGVTALAIAVAYPRQAVLARAAALCLGPVAVAWSARVHVHGLVDALSAVLFFGMLLIPLGVLLYAWRRAGPPASTVLLAVAGAYWVLLGWLTEIAVFA